MNVILSNTNAISSEKYDWINVIVLGFTSNEKKPLILNVFKTT